jgi:hypothetical protein
MNIIIQSTLKTLQKAENLLSNLSDDALCNTEVAPYHSSIGSHLRHILDFYDCVLNCNNCTIDLTVRNRNADVENSCLIAQNYLATLTNKLKQLNDFDREMLVIDDLGLGKVEIKYSISAILAQANSHTIHHYAIINYILDGLNIAVTDEDFGYNPTTPKQESLAN